MISYVMASNPARHLEIGLDAVLLGKRLQVAAISAFDDLLCQHLQTTSCISRNTTRLTTHNDTLKRYGMLVAINRSTAERFK